MTEQQYRVIADRDKGDDPTWADIGVGDRYTATWAGDESLDVVLRIERLVPTTDEPKSKREQIVSDLAAMGQQMFTPSVPTREQIAEVLYQESGDWKLHRIPWSTVLNMTDPVIRDGYFRRADAVLALFQNGADRDE